MDQILSNTLGNAVSEDDALLMNESVMEAAHIFMVDDEPLNMEVLQLHLEAEGYTNFTCISDSTVALDQIIQYRPDVVLLDLDMPEVNGFDILFDMRENTELKFIPVIVLTSSDEAPMKLKALHLGATDFLSKPVDECELALRMRNTLAAKAYQHRLMYLDPLTRLPNRLFFTQATRSALHNFSRHETVSSMVLINIDRFKLINDSLGPERGDEVIWAFSQRILTSFELSESSAGAFVANGDKGALAARVGGDRFALLVPSQDELPDLSMCLERFVEAMVDPLIVDNQEIYLNMSIGVSQLNEDTESVEQLINDAETACLYAGRSRNKQYAFYTEKMNEKALEILSIENGLRSAVDNDEIFVVYQPKVDVAGRYIAGAEALVRWQHPEFGLVSPVDFITIAEDTGMIVTIGEWVLRESCRQTMQWRNAGYTNLKIAVNVSIRQMQETDFVERVGIVLQESGLPPEALIIELTENMIMDNAEANILKLQEIKALGVDISIDDFGTGYSSLSYLQRFPINQLKIDQSFIREIEKASDNHPIVKAVVSLAHDLGMRVVAEGVETIEQLAHVHKVGVEEYQGYLCSKPVVAAEFEQLLSSDAGRIDHAA